MVRAWTPPRPDRTPRPASFPPAGPTPRPGLARLGLAGLLATSLLVCLSATRSELLVPSSLRPLPASLAGPLAGAGLKLGVFALIAAFIAMFASYAAATRSAERLSSRTVLVAILALHAIVLLAPPLFSSDVFSYAAYGRSGAAVRVGPERLVATRAGCPPATRRPGREPSAGRSRGSGRFRAHARLMGRKPDI